MLDMKQIESFYPEHLHTFKRNLLREYVQYKILEIIFNSEFGSSLAFMGGTAIHIIHGNTRFSEDLDFDNLKLTEGEFQLLAESIERGLKREGYTAEIRTVLKEAYSVSVKISKILFEYKLSAHKDENLLIKVDAEPQKFPYTSDQPILNKFDIFLRINVVPVDILLSQKLYAIFKRKRPIGRDFYDAIFLSAKAKPHFGYLKAKLGMKSMQDLKEKLSEKCRDLNFKQLAEDVEPFLFHPGDSRKVLLFPDYIDKILQ